MARTGIVTIPDFDRGIMGLLGATLRNGVVSGKPSYWVTVADVEYEPSETGVMCYVVPPEQVIRKYILPSILIRPGDPEPDMIRWQGGQAEEYCEPAVGATTVTGVNGVSGYNAYETKEQAVPVQLSYDIQILSRYTRDARAIWQQVMRNIRSTAGPNGSVVYCQVPVIDSLGEIRHYLGVINSFGVNNDVADVMRRRAMHVISIRVQGELDFGDPVVQRSIVISTPTVTFSTM